MLFRNAFIPYRVYWSTPFCRWQGAFSHLHSVRFAAEITKRALSEKRLSPEIFDGLVLGITVPQKASFYGAPWLAGMIGAKYITGAMISQACATSVKCIVYAATMIEQGINSCLLTVLCDRTSNSPHIYYPNPSNPGGVGDSEDWVWDNFGNDPYAGNAMIETAERVAKEYKIDRKYQEEVTLMRYNQYLDSLKDNASFQKRFMILPIEVRDAAGKKIIKTVEGDEGVYPTTKEGLASLKPVLPDGTITYGTQTHPADGNCGMIITTKEKAYELSGGEKPVQIVSFGEARTEKGYMPKAIVPAAYKALERAGLKFDDLKVLKTHNPFAVNDIYFSKETGFPIEKMNNYGSSLVYGHPQAPTGARAIMEMIEELLELGGGYGLFTGCAAGDTASSLIIRVE